MVREGGAGGRRGRAGAGAARLLVALAGQRLGERANALVLVPLGRRAELDGGAGV